jgi:ribokinase
MAPGGVVVVGSVNTDYVVFLDRRPEPGETVLGTSLAVHGGGKGANQALAAARSGAPTQLIACLGDDAAGDARLRTLADGGVGTQYVRRAATASGAAFITVTPDGENDIIVVPGANAQLLPSDIERAGAAFSEAAVVVVQLEVPLNTVSAAVARAGTAATVVLNCAPFGPLPDGVLDRVDVLVVNEIEAGALTGGQVDGVPAALAVAQSALDMGPAAVVVTLGPDGAVVVSRGLREHIPAYRVTPVDTTGAGDAFVGALAARLARGEPLPSAVAFGVEVGTATTQRVGAEAIVPGRGPGL